MQLLSDIGGFNGLIIMMIRFIVNNVCLKNTTSQFDTVKRSFPYKRTNISELILKNPNKIQSEDISNIKDKFSRKRFKNIFLIAFFMLLPKILRCKFVNRQLRDEFYLKKGLKKLYKSQDVI